MAVITTKRIGKIIECARRELGIPQDELIRKLNAQSEDKVGDNFLSDLVQNKTECPATVWFHLTGILGIPADSINTGYLDFMQPAETTSAKKEGGFFIADEFRYERSIAVRFLAPILEFYCEEYSEEQLELGLWELGFDPAFFIRLDNKVSPLFLESFMERFFDSRLLQDLEVNGEKSRLIRFVSQFSSQFSHHGSLGDLYSTAMNHSDLISLYVNSQSYYESIFENDIEVLTEDKLRYTLRLKEEFDPSLFWVILLMEHQKKEMLKSFASSSINNEQEDFFEIEEVRSFLDSLDGQGAKETEFLIYRLAS